MFDLTTFAYTSAVLSIIAVVLWIASRIKNDVGIVDSFWSLMILAAGISFFIIYTLHDHSVISERSLLVLILLSVKMQHLHLQISMATVTLIYL